MAKNSISYPSSSGGDMILAVAQTNTGAKTFNAATLLDKGNMSFNVKAYGALGDNSTDDTAAVQAALNAAEAAGGGIVHFQGGTFILGALIVYSNTILEGTTGTILKLKSSTNAYMFTTKHTQASPDVYRFNHTFKNIKFDLNRTGNTTTATAIDAYQTRSLTVDQCKFVEFKGDCVKVRGGSTSDLYSIQPRVLTSEFDSGDTSTGSGLRLGDGCYDGIVMATDFGRSYRGIVVDPTSTKNTNHTFVSVWSWGQNNAGAYFTNSDSNQFVNCTFDRNFGHGLVLNASSKNVFQGNKFSNNSFYDEFNEFGLGVMGSTNTYSGLYVSGSSIDISLVNTLFTNPDGDQKYGIETNGTGNEVYQLNCLFDGNATDGFLQSSSSTIRNIDVSSRPFLMGKLAIQSDGVWENETNGSGAVAFNYNGYNGGTSQFRDTAFFDGKNNEIGRFVGSTKTLTLTNPMRPKQRIGTTASSATPTPDSDAYDQYNVTALAAGATFAAPTGTPNDGQELILRIKDNGTARSLAFNAIYRFSSDLAAPTTTVLSKTIYIKFVYNAADTKWDCLAWLSNL